jgi:phenylacetate-CoA ligase
MLYRIGREFFSKHPKLTTGIVASLANLLPWGLRYGPEYRRVRRFLDESQWWSRERLEHYQLGKLKETIEFAYHNVPFYKEHFDSHGVSPSDLWTLEDIRRFPIIEKKDMLENLERFLAKDIDRSKLMAFCTGGTTGSGVTLQFYESFRQREHAFVRHHWDNVGYRDGMLTATLQHQACPEDVNDGIWYMDKIANSMVLSADALTPKTVGSYLEVLERYRPRVLITYPSLANHFANCIEEQGYTRRIFDLVLCSSEALYDYQRKRLESAFRARVRIHYGHIESCAFFSNCEKSTLYHDQMEYGYTEFRKRDGSPAEEGESGEIIATGFDNVTMPLIRFRTQDWAERGAGKCDCGRNYPLVTRIEGREGDFIRAPSGRSYSPIVLEFLVDGTVGFADLQIVQTKIDDLVVKVVPGRDFSAQRLEDFCAALRARLDHEISVSSELVELIPRPHRQKRSLVVSEL